MLTLKEGHCVSVLATLPADSVQCCVTSPPYWGLRRYGTPPQRWADGWVGELGGEPDPEGYLAHLLEVFAQVKRVLRPDGTCFVNLGDTYWNDPGGQNGAESGISDKAKEANRQVGRRKRATGSRHPVLKRKDLCLLPWRFALAMQAAGWYVRSVIVWHKLAAMPESVRDRPASAWEPIFLFTRSQRYFWDAEAVRQPLGTGSVERGYTYVGRPETSAKMRGAAKEVRANATWRVNGYVPTGANLRNVWPLAHEGLADAHYAAFPSELPRRCLLAGTSQQACARCGAPWVRELEKTAMVIRRTDWGEKAGNRTAANGTMRVPPTSKTVGWRPSCACGPAAGVRPCLVLDPFAGGGTTLREADRLGRDAVGIELQAAYVRLAERRCREDAPLFADVTVAAVEAAG